jgi:hypothetical protein
MHDCEVSIPHIRLPFELSRNWVSDSAISMLAQFALSYYYGWRKIQHPKAIMLSYHRIRWLAE